MKIKEIFTIGGVVSILDDKMDYLNGTNCQVFNKSLNDDFIVLRLRGDKDAVEGDSLLGVKDQFKQIKKDLLNKVFVNQDMMGLTLDQLRDLETNIEIESSGGHMYIK